MKIAGVVIPYGCADIRDGQAGGFEEKGCLVQPLDLEKFFVSPPQKLFDGPAEPGNLIAQKVCQTGHLPVPIVVVDIAQHLEAELLVTVPW